MNPLMKVSGIALLMVLASACATGMKYAEVASSIKPPRAEMGRIYLFRTSPLGAAVKPKIFLDDKVIGKAVAKGFFYVDVLPGTHQLRTTTEVKRTLSMTLQAGEVRYVRLKVAVGFFVGHVAPELVDNAVGEREITKCRYTGK